MRDRDPGRAWPRKSTIDRKRAERAQLFRLEDGQPGKSVLQGREDLDALDRVDAEVGVELHVEIENFGGISGFLGNDLDQDGGERLGRPTESTGRLGRRSAVGCSARQMGDTRRQWRELVMRFRRMRRLGSGCFGLESCSSNLVSTGGSQRRSCGRMPCAVDIEQCE